MDTEERRHCIEALIKEKKELDVNFIKERFGISSVTVRNDLIYLERKGVIKRLFGKAVLLEESLLPTFDLNNIKNLNEKEKIGKYAASLIKDDESVMLYTGTTTLQVARYMDNSKNIIVVTNSIYIAYELSKKPNIKTVFIGGNLNPDTGSTYGGQAIHQLNEYKIDKLFVAVEGIDAEMGITNDQPYETDINRAMIEKANQVIVVADYSKIGATHFVSMGEIEDIDILITDSKAPMDKIESIRSRGVEVIIV